MPAPHNRLKARLARGELCRGLWLGMASPVAAEIAAGAGLDWCLIDAEHGPNDLSAILAQMQAIAAAGQGSEAVVRVPAGEAWILKQVLDLGAQTVMVPMVETPEQARAMVAAVRYPPQGLRGLAAPVVRASGWNAAPDYAETADREICLVLQIESRRGLENLEAIAAVEGVDCLFVGPSDLGADLGHPPAEELEALVDETLARIRAAGRSAGTIAFDPRSVPRRMAAGANFIAVGADVLILAQAARELARG